MIAESWLGRLQRRRPLPASPSAVRPGAARARPGLHRPNRRLLIAALALGVLLAGAWLWVRDSSLVSVQRVSVSGQSGPDAGQIRSALIATARNMTTLDVHIDQLRTAVAPYPVVRDLQVSTQFPHGMRIRVIEQTPVAAVLVGGRTIAVAGDGTLLHDVVAAPSLPTIPVRVAPGGPRLSEPDSLHAVAILAAAPYQLLGRISQVGDDPSHGLVAQLRSGPAIYFGDGSRLAAKWIATVAVLADAGSAGAAYIDVTDPARPVAGAPPATTSPPSATTGTTVAGAGTTSVASPPATTTPGG